MINPKSRTLFSLVLNRQGVQGITNENEQLNSNQMIEYKLQLSRYFTLTERESENNYQKILKGLPFEVMDF